MEHYLYHQAILVREVRAEAMRLGRYPEPGEAPSLRPDGQSIIAGPRTSSVAWYQNRRESEEQAPIGIRPSPSSPADLAHMSRPHRPQVQFTASRAADRQSMGSSLRVDPEEPWPPISSAELRPFSFAVRAGAARESNDGHGKRTVLGRWGGSVTSFFGGSQGGSGSMMDMQYVLAEAKLTTVSASTTTANAEHHPITSTIKREQYHWPRLHVHPSSAVIPSFRRNASLHHHTSLRTTSRKKVSRDC